MRPRGTNKATVHLEGRQSSSHPVSVGLVQKLALGLQVEIRTVVWRNLLPGAVRRGICSCSRQSRSGSRKMQRNRRDKGKEHERFSPETLTLGFGYSVSTFQMPWEESALLRKE